MRLIDKVNRFSRRALSEEEVYIFSVVLCDNEIDHDYECFSDSALETLKKLFIGRAGVFDYVSSTTNLTARIFDTELVTDNSRTTKYGASYKYLKVSAYMVRTAENKSFIAEIDGGIKKEVSISCSTAKRICSICGCNKNKGNCSHEKWKSYGGKQCYTILDDITDAYEWSFVSVPIQANAICNRPVEAEPVRHGEWLYSDIYLPNCAECSECGWKSSASGDEIPSYHYCPNCGAKMDGGCEDENHR